MLLKLIGVVIYLLVLLVIGAAASRQMKDVRDYFAGGKRMGYWVIAFSTRATGESAWLLLGLTGMGATIGVQALWVLVGAVLGILISWFVMARRFKNLTDRYDSITIPEYFASRFRDTGHKLRLVSAVALIVFVTIYVSAQIDATGTAFESFLGWNYYLGALFGFVVVVIYIVSGGFVAVVWSDVFQGLLMLLGLVALPIAALFAAGGASSVVESLRAQDPSLLELSFGKNLSEVFRTLSLLLIGLGYLGSPQLYVRFLALRSTAEIKKGAAVALSWTLFAKIGAILIGLVGRTLLLRPGSTLGPGGQNVLPLLVDTILPPLLIGIYIAIVLSAIMSTVDSLLVLAASAVVRDFYQKVRHPDLHDDALIGMSRKVTFGLAAAALAISMLVAVTTPTRTIFWFVIFGWSGISATFCPTMVLSLFWPRMTARGALSAMLVGFLAVPFFKFVAPRLPVVGDALRTLTELPPSFALSALAGILTSLLDRAGQARLEGVERELEVASSR